MGNLLRTAPHKASPNGRPIGTRKGPDIDRPNDYRYLRTLPLEQARAEAIRLVESGQVKKVTF